MIAPIRKIGSSLFAAAMALCNCGDSSPSDCVPIHDQSLPGRVIYIGQSIEEFNAESGDFVIMIMDYPGPLAIDRCFDMGGEPIYNSYTNILQCEGIDF